MCIALKGNQLKETRDSNGGIEVYTPTRSTRLSSRGEVTTVEKDGKQNLEFNSIGKRDKGGFLIRSVM